MIIYVCVIIYIYDYIYMYEYTYMIIFLIWLYIYDYKYICDYIYTVLYDLFIWLYMHPNVYTYIIYYIKGLTWHQISCPSQVNLSRLESPLVNLSWQLLGSISNGVNGDPVEVGLRSWLR
jgi:hypothetical protein